MFGRFRKPDPLKTTIAEILTDMQGFNAESPEYERLLARVERLKKLQTTDRRWWHVSPDTLAVVAGNILGILIIVGYERTHVMTTRAKEYIQKP